MVGVDFCSPEFIATSVVVLAVPFCPGLRELEVLPKGSIRIASLLSRVEVPPGIFLFSLCQPFYPVSSRCFVKPRAEDTRFLESLFLLNSMRITFLNVDAFEERCTFVFLLLIRVNDSENPLTAYHFHLFGFLCSIIFVTCYAMLPYATYFLYEVDTFRGSLFSFS